MHQSKEGDQNDCDQENTKKQTDQETKKHKDPSDDLFWGSDKPAGSNGIMIKVPNWDFGRGK